jgi:hypothetical protein
MWIEGVAPGQAIRIYRSYQKIIDVWDIIVLHGLYSQDAEA